MMIKAERQGGTAAPHKWVDLYGDQLYRYAFTRVKNPRLEMKRVLPIAFPETSGVPHHLRSKERSVRETLLMGVFWRILIIEVILLIGTLAYEAGFRDADPLHLFWYALRILGLVSIIILFMMVTLQRFLKRKIIVPLEAIAAANERFQKDHDRANDVDLPEETPKEIKGIASTRRQMLETILDVSEERLQLANFIRDTFGRYLSRKVVDQIIENPAGRRIGGRRETVTVLMSDLRGFTTMSEASDPEEMVLLLNRYLARMSDIILEYDGMIDEFVGDAILVFFGVPENGEDDPARAVACALAMQNALQALNNEITAEGYPALEMGIGINTGPVIVGNIGSEVRAKYGIVGTVVNRTARIESNTVGGQVLIGEPTYRLVRELVKTDPPRSVAMKGLKSPLVFYPVKAIGPPYDVVLFHSKEEKKGAEIQIPFHCWKVEDKKITGEQRQGVTVMLGEQLISASIDPSFEPMTDIKLAFEFCTEAHCFEEIYAKVLPPEDRQKKATHLLRITSIAPKDREVLKRWISEMS
jgi:adenylate cyclase